MRYTRHLLVLALVAAASITFIAPSRVKAIVYGFVDTGNVFNNTGAFIVKSPATGSVFPICSGTLISPTVFLTASHCTVFFENDLAAARLGPSSVSTTRFLRRSDQQSVQTDPGHQVVTNPNFNQAQSDTGDIAVLVRANDTRGLTPAQLPPDSLIDWPAKRPQAPSSLRSATDCKIE